MLFDPDDGKTMEEVFEIAFRGMTPEHQARVEAEARAAGCSVQEIMEACVMAGEHDGWKDTCAYFEWARQPYGKDPLLTQREHGGAE